MIARIQGKRMEWDEAVTQARDEYRKQGDENPPRLGVSVHLSYVCLHT
ncbi:MAG: hypothetical protein LBD79_05415 [Treponema sp.]|jgi:hypothetical protein|nr:hypothetical protein [Treponema sp.]